MSLLYLVKPCKRCRWLPPIVRTKVHSHGDTDTRPNPNPKREKRQEKERKLKICVVVTRHSYKNIRFYRISTNVNEDIENGNVHYCFII